MDDQKGADVIKAVYDDGFVEIHGREYHFLKMRHQQRRSVFAFFSSIQRDIQRQDFSFLDDPRFATVEKIIGDAVTYEGSLLSKRPGHWDDYPQDYLIFVSTALAVISYPFMPASDTSSPSPEGQRPKSTSKKPM